MDSGLAPPKGGPPRNDGDRYGNRNEKGPEELSGPCSATLPTARYLSAVCTEVKVVFNFEPSPATTVMIATEMPAAIKPYSISVAPRSSFPNRDRSFVMSDLPLVTATARETIMGALRERCPAR